VPVKKSAHEVRGFALQIGETQALTLGNQTVTYVRDPRSGFECSVTLIWSTNSDSAFSVPFRVQVTSGRTDPTDTADIDRMLGLMPTKTIPLSSTMLRRIPYEKIIDASRKALIESNSFLSSNKISIPHQLQSETLLRQKKKGRPFDRPDEFYEKVAKLYIEAILSSGSVARKPSKYIATKLAQEVRYLSSKNRSAQIRKWVAEARKRGLLEVVKDHK
jgi:hypothetical protein